MYTKSARNGLHQPTMNGTKKCSRSCNQQQQQQYKRWRKGVCGNIRNKQDQRHEINNNNSCGQKQCQRQGTSTMLLQFVCRIEWSCTRTRDGCCVRDAIRECDFQWTFDAVERQYKKYLYASALQSPVIRLLVQ